MAEVDVEDYFDQVVDEVASKWKDLARKLKFHGGEIQEIEQTVTLHGPKDKCREVLERWGRGRQNGPDPTLQVLKEALIKINEVKLAKSLGGDSIAPIPTPNKPSAPAPRGNVEDYFDHVITNVSCDWKKLALKLGIVDNQIRVIDRNGDDDDDKCREVLTRWRKSKGRDATLQALQEALIKINQRQIAEELEQVP